MSDNISKSIAVHSSDVFLEVLAEGSRPPASSEIRFSISPRREKLFYISVGQMTLNPMLAGPDYQELADIRIDRFPQAPSDALDIYVVVHLETGNNLYVEIIMTPENSGEALQESLIYGPFPVE